MMIIQTSYSSSLMFQSDCLPSQVGPPLLSLHSAPDKAIDVSLRRQHPPFEDVWDPWPSMCQGSYSTWGWPLTLVRNHHCHAVPLPGGEFLDPLCTHCNKSVLLTATIPVSLLILLDIVVWLISSAEHTSPCRGTGGHSSEGSCLANKLKPICFRKKKK